MKAAILSESEADDAVLRIIAERVIEGEIEWYPPPHRGRGQAGVRKSLPSVIRHLHYHTDVDLLIVVVDSDHTEPHDESHDKLKSGKNGCRLCILRQITRDVRRTLKHVPTRSPLCFAIGLASPCIEAWLLHGKSAEANEASWKQHLRQKESSSPWASKLKQEKYGTDKPTLPIATDLGSGNARRIAADLSELVSSFPGGLAPLIDGIRAAIQ